MTDDPFLYLRAMLCLVVAAGYLLACLLGARRIPLPYITHVSGVTFMLCGAVKNVALALHIYGSDWFVINELVQAGAAVIFTSSLYRLVNLVLQRRDSRQKGPSASEVR